MQLVGFRLKGKTYKSMFQKGGKYYLADLHKGKVRISKMSSSHGELCLSLPIEVDAEEYWVLGGE